MTDLHALLADSPDHPAHRLTAMAEPGMDAAIAALYAQRLRDAETWAVFALLGRDELDDVQTMLAAHDDGHPVNGADLANAVRALFGLTRR